MEGPASDLVQPTCPEEKHAQKPTWRRGYRQFGKTEYLLATLTPSDCSTKRLRPPREWYDSLLGASHMSFVAGAQAPDGAPVSFLLKAHAYSYVPAEYYIQVGGLAGVGARARAGAVCCPGEEAGPNSRRANRWLPIPAA